MLLFATALVLALITVVAFGTVQIVDALDQRQEDKAIALQFFDPWPSCRKCGCNDDRACVSEKTGPCHWVEPDLCSACTQTSLEAS